MRNNEFNVTGVLPTFPPPYILIASHGMLSGNCLARLSLLGNCLGGVGLSTSESSTSDANSMEMSLLASLSSSEEELSKETIVWCARGSLIRISELTTLWSPSKNDLHGQSLS